MKRLCALILCLCAYPFALHANEEHPMFHHSGLPIPRFVSLKSSEVNVRVGPGERYPIQWVYKRKGWPVEIIEEFGHWRKIRDSENSEGWVHKNLLSGDRSVLVTGERRPLYLAPDGASRVVMEVDPMVAGGIISCVTDWCQLVFDGHEGWIRRHYLWGIKEGELIAVD